MPTMYSRNHQDGKRGEDDSRMRCIKILQCSESSQKFRRRIPEVGGGVDCRLCPTSDCLGSEGGIRPSRRLLRMLRQANWKRRRGRMLDERAKGCSCYRSSPHDLSIGTHSTKIYDCTTHSIRRTPQFTLRPPRSIRVLVIQGPFNLRTIPTIGSAPRRWPSSCLRYHFPCVEREFGRRVGCSVAGDTPTVGHRRSQQGKDDLLERERNNISLHFSECYCEICEM